MSGSLLRPKVVSEFQASRVTAERFKWKLFAVGTWVATLGAGLYTAMQTFEGLPGSGEHVLTPLQRLLRRAADDAMLFGSAAAAVPTGERQTAAAVDSAAAPSPAPGSTPELR